MKEYRSGQRSNVSKSRISAASSADRQDSAVCRPFAVFDIDGTLIRWQLYHALADALAKRGYIQPEDYQNIRDARMDWKRRTGDESFKKYEIQLIKAYEKVLRKLTVNQLGEVAETVFQEYKDQAYTYTRDLITELKNKGYLLFAISGSQIEIVEKIAKHYGFDDCVGSVSQRKGDKFTGKVTVASLYKDTILRKLIDKHGASLKGSVAVGDGLSDIGMLDMVEKPIAFNPEKRLLTRAQERGWEIVVERKNVIYELRHGQNGQYELV
jgi:HAD superfamily hydrolase (TIGR01490 family)